MGRWGGGWLFGGGAGGRIAQPSCCWSFAELSACLKTVREILYFPLCYKVLSKLKILFSSSSLNPEQNNKISKQAGAEIRNFTKQFIFRL